MDPSVLLLAFGFASPWLLWGLAGACAPILIHLLSRRKHRETTWAAMRFLVAAVRKNSRRMQMEQWLLLAVRTLLLVVVTLALTRPTFETLGSFFQADVPTHRILVLDASASMAVSAGGETLFDRARQTARRIVDESLQGDAWQLVRLSALPPQTLIKSPAYQPSAVAAEIDGLSLPHGPADAPRALAQVVDLLKSIPALPRKEVIIVSDFQQATWQPSDTAQQARLRDLLRELDASSRVVFLDVGVANRPNAAVTSLSLADPLAVAGRPARVRVSVRNFGREELSNVPVELLVEGKLVEQRRASIPAGEEWSETLSITFSGGGLQRVVARLPDDDLPLDNARYLAVDVQDKLRVLLVAGRTDRGPLSGSVAFLHLALNPRSGTDSATGLAIEPTVISDGELAGTDLARFQAVFVCDVRSFSPAEVRQLETYVRAGGGLVISLGDTVAIPDYNALLWRDGQGLLPAQLLDRVGRSPGAAGDRATEVPRPADAPAEKTFDFLVDEASHPLVSAFEGNPDAGLETTRTFAYIRTLLAPDSTAKAPLRFETRDPALIEQRVGAGRVVLCTTTLDGSWTTWPFWPSFVPMMQELVLFVVSGQTNTTPLLVGMPLEKTVRTGGLDLSAVIRRPDEEERPALIQAEGQLAVWRYDDTDQVGLYAARFSGVELPTDLLAVNFDTVESDLAKLAEPELLGDIAQGLGVTYLTEWRKSTTPARGPVVERGGGLSRGLLYAAMYLLAVEQVLAWNFSLGLALLCPPLWLLKRLRTGPKP